MIRTALLVLLLAPTLAGAQPRLLVTGAFHGDEVQARNGEEWFALYALDGRSELRREVLTVRPVFDPVLDADGEETGREVLTNDSQPATLLIDGVDLRSGPIETVLAELTVLAPGQTLSIAFGGRTLVLYANATMEFSATGEVSYHDYELVMSDGETEQVLIELPRLEEGVPALRWAGDLDRDGRLDLFIDTTHHYNLSRPTLFLSRPAGSGVHVEQVASFSSVGC